MNEQINLYLNLPVIGGKLTAYTVEDWKRKQEEFKKQFPEFKDKYLYSGVPEYVEFGKKVDHIYYLIEWKITFTVGVNDARFNDGFAVIYGEQTEYLPRTTFEEFYETFKDALKKMKVLSNHTFDGTYKKTVGNLRALTLEVVGENNEIYLNFWVSSNTRSFSLKLDTETVEEIIEKLKDVPNKALELMVSLDELCK